MSCNAGCRHSHTQSQPRWETESFPQFSEPLAWMIRPLSPLRSLRWACTKPLPMSLTQHPEGYLDCIWSTHFPTIFYLLAQARGSELSA